MEKYISLLLLSVVFFAASFFLPVAKKGVYPTGARLHAAGKGFGIINITKETTNTTSILGYPKKTRAQEKAQYRKLLKIAKATPSLKNGVVSSSDKDIFVAQRKQAW